MKDYRHLVQEEINEWKKIETEIFKNGIPWWVDLRRAKLTGKNIFWRNDPEKERIIRGEEKELLISLATQSGKRILDLGCGSGWLSLELGRRRLEVVGVDMSKDRLAIARRFLKENPYKKNFGKVKYVAGDLNKINFPKNSFDVIVTWDTLHHFPNFDEILIKGKQWLVPGGTFIVFDHVGNRLLKLSRKILEILSKKHRSKIISYEDVLGRKMIILLEKYFRPKIFKTRLAFPISALLYLLLSRDVFLPILPFVVKIDKLLCDSHLFYGEYFFFYGKKK